MKGVTSRLALSMPVIVISTHTPVKGVTIQAGSSAIDNNISTHTPVKGVTNLHK